MSKQNENPDGHEMQENEGTAARTRPTSVEEIRLRRKRKESLENVTDESVGAGAAQLLGNDLVEKTSDYHESGKGNDRSRKMSHEERVMNSSRKKEDTTFSSREGLDKPMIEDPEGAAQLLANNLVEKISDYEESVKGYDRSKILTREERGMDSSSKKEDAISDLREEKLENKTKEDPLGAAQLVGNDLVDKVTDYLESEKEDYRSEELVKDNSRNKLKEDANSSYREEKLDKAMKEDPIGAAQLLGNDLVEKVPDYYASEKRHDRSRKVRHEERVKDSSRKKEDATSSSREERIDKPKKEDPVGAAQLLGNDLVEKVPDYHESIKRHDGSRKVRHEEHVKGSSRKKEDATSSFREERIEKPKKEVPVGAAQLLDKNPVEKVFDYHESEKGHDRSKKVKREELVKGSSRKKEDAISSSREKKLDKSIKKDPAGAAQLLGNDIVEKVSDYHDSEKRYDRSEKLRRAERVKDSSRKKKEVNSITREKLDKPIKEEGTAANRKRKAEGEGFTAETKLVEKHIKDTRRKREETDSSCKEERLDKKMKKEDLAANRKIEGEFPTTEKKTITDIDGLDMDTKIKAKRESSTAKPTEKIIYPQETDREKARSALENLPGSRNRLRSLVVADIAQDENSMKPDNGSKRKNQNGDHKKNRERNMSKRHDSGKVHSVEVSERWEKREQPKSHQRDMREKRRRSRSRDRGHDRQKRSSSLPRAEKATSRHKRDHVEQSEIAVKDRSGKHHLNDSENKVASTASNKSRRYNTSKSDLGGYSPRKRREETSTKAASPPNLSSDKKSGKWDLVPTVTTGMFSGSVFSGLQAATQTTYPTISEAPLTLLKPILEVPFMMPLARQTTSFDSVQLTESTRRLRRLYAENVPNSASEKSLIECFNGYMLSSGSNHIKGSEPCISCIINKEKSQALVEFLTPQDASTALSLDGFSFAGSNLKIRRPKDYVETTSGELEKKAPATNALNDNVEDSSSKIFIGGFPKAITSEMVLEIANVFGPLKAYRFVTNNDLNQRCAFLEYTDGSVTLKACAGLNGMKLGGSVITAVCAFPDASSLPVNENPPFYGIPEHAKPLLCKPKHILKLKNVVDPEDLLSLSEPEVKEILEDVRLECARFGVIKSINIVEHQSKDITGSETNALLNLESTGSKEMNVSVKEEESNKADDIADNIEPEVVRPDSSTGEDNFCELSSDTAIETNIQGNKDQHSTEHDDCEKIVGESAEVKAHNPEEVGSTRALKTRWDADEKIDEVQEQDPKDVFEPGCIFIEYRRPEATLDAAHSLNGRLYENRIVKVEYVSKELYQMRFPSG